MQTNDIHVICPKCGSVDSYSITDYVIVDDELVLSCQCLICQEKWTEHYLLCYIGYSNNAGYHDRDGLLMKI